MIITINDENKVISKASGKIFANAVADNVKSFVVDTLPPVAEDVELYLNPETKEFYTQPKVVSAKTRTEEERKAIGKAIQAEAQALKWLADNDWKPNKIIRKEWTEDDPRWIEYLNKCAEMRATIDHSNAIIRGGENG